MESVYYLAVWLIVCTIFIAIDKIFNDRTTDHCDYAMVWLWPITLPVLIVIGIGFLIICAPEFLAGLIAGPIVKKKKKKLALDRAERAELDRFREQALVELNSSILTQSEHNVYGLTNT